MSGNKDFTDKVNTMLDLIGKAVDYLENVQTKTEEDAEKIMFAIDELVNAMKIIE